MGNIAAFEEDDAKLILKAAKAWQAQQTRMLSKPGRVTRGSIYAKVVTPIETTEGNIDHNKQATAIEVVYDVATYSFVEVEVDPIRYENDNLDSAGATLFDTTNISSSSALTAGQIVELQHYPNLSDTSDWLVVEGAGGGASRSYVIVTSVTDAANYVGNVLVSPNDATVLETGVTIQVAGAVANPFKVDYDAFADKVDNIYFLEGDLIG